MNLRSRRRPAVPATIPVPPEHMPGRQGLRPLKRWRYVGLFGADLMACAGIVGVGPMTQSFWALWDRRTGSLDTETRLGRSRRICVRDDSLAVSAGSARLELTLSPVGRAVEVVSPHGGSYIWTRKVPIRADGHYSLGMGALPVSAFGILDESAGYHARRTEWEWSAGVGTSVDGWPVVWNLVRGVHDAETASERTVWVSGRPQEAPPVRFASDLSELWGADGTLLSFDEEARRSRRERRVIVSSDYIQPFGRFRGVLPGGVGLSDQDDAFGVMERHRAKW